jgi:MFS family permease
MRTHVRSSRQQPNLSLVTAVVCTALGAVSAAMASLNVAIPDLVRSTHASQTQLEWIIDAYLLVFSVLLLPAGALGDRYGRRKALIGGLIVFGGASAAAMTVTSANDLIFLRGLIGLGAALVMPATLSTITGTFPRAERTKAVGVWAAVAGGSAILGLLASGLLLQWFSWQAAFAINVLLAALALAGTVRFVPESSQPDAPALDKGGAVLATVGLVALVFSIIEAPDAGWLSARTLAGVAAGLVALAGFVVFELRRRHPLLDPHLFSNRRLSAGSLSICIQFFAFFGFTFVSLQYLEGVRGYSPPLAALAVLPLSATMMPAARVTSTLASRFGPRAVCVTGLVLVAAGLVVISRVGTDTSYLLILAGLVPLGVGMGAAMTPATAAITEALPQAQQGVGSALNDLSERSAVPSARRSSAASSLPSTAPASNSQASQLHSSPRHGPPLQSRSTPEDQLVPTPATRSSTASTPGCSTQPPRRSSPRSAWPSCSRAGPAPAGPSVRVSARRRLTSQSKSIGRRLFPAMRPPRPGAFLRS